MNPSEPPDKPTATGWASPEGGPALTPGTRVGQYLIHRRIGDGGMGSVFEAEQQKPHRVVALKIINPGYLNRDVIRRFERESETLGRLHHPGIAQIFDAGTFDTPRGTQPFFVMELIRGEAITDFADRHDLSVEKRLELIADVALAVQHAHQRGVIHRDLKPANILVTEPGQPKVLDFGVARTIDPDARGSAVDTKVGQLIGTVQYMSPEQTAGDPHEIDTRSDIYSLGVVAYEVLTGEFPYEIGGQLHEVVNAIQAQDPRPLSSISRIYRGDVETIIAKTLDKRKDHRYQDAGELASDIRRFIRNEPIVARPPTAWYQLVKFTRRNRTLVAAGAVLSMVIMAAAVALAATTVRAIRAEAAARRHAEDAMREAESSRASLDFLVNTLGSMSAKDRGPLVKLATVFEAGRARIDTDHLEHPLIRIRLHETYGRVYRMLGMYQDSEQELAKSVDLAIESSVEDEHLVDLLLMHGAVLVDLGRIHHAGERFLEAREVTMRLGEPPIPLALALGDSMGFVAHDLGDYDLAEFHHRNTLLLQETLGLDEFQASSVHMLLAWLLIDRDELEQAEMHLQKALTQVRSAPEDARVSIAFGRLCEGYLYYAEQDWMSAAEAFRSSRDIYAEVHADEFHPMAEVSRAFLAAVVNDAPPEHRPAEADPTGEQALDRVGEVMPDLLVKILRNRARVTHRLGSLQRSSELFAASVERARQLDEAGTEAHTLREWARHLQDARDLEQARARYEQALILQQGHLTGYWQTVMTPTLLGYATVLMELDEFDAAGLALDRAIGLREAALPDDAWPTAVAETRYAEYLAETGRRAEARRRARHAATVLEAALGRDDHRTARALRVLEIVRSGSAG